MYDLYNLIGLKYNETFMHSDMSYHQYAKTLIDDNPIIKCNIYLDNTQNMNNS